MGHHPVRESFHTPASSISWMEIDDESEVEWPFGKVDVDGDELREAAYEIFFTACRSSPGFGGKNALSYYPSVQESSDCTSPKNGLSTVTVATSRTKRALGLKSLKRSSPRRALTTSNSGSFGSPGTPSTRFRRPITSAELMRQQMRVTDQSDTRLRKTLMRTLVGQMGRRVETIILPLELLRHLKPSEFNDTHEYFLWQRRQLKILEAGLLQHPSIPLDRSNSSAMRLREIIRSSEAKAIDTGKNSETMKAFCNCVVALAWRNPNGIPSDVCRWADGFPLNLHIYLVLLQSIFDLREDTGVVDEVDELIELMKKTWSTLGINRLVHNVCFTWVLFHQFVSTGQTEQDLLCAASTMLAEVANDAKRSDREFVYVKILSSTLTSIQRWADKKLINYHEVFPKGATGLMENILPLPLSAENILENDVASTGGTLQDKENKTMDSTGNKIDFYIRSSLRNAFARMLESKSSEGVIIEEDDETEEDSSDVIVRLAKETEDLAMKEKEYFSCVLNKWHPIAAGVAAVTLHHCLGEVLKQYLSGVSTPSEKVIQALQAAGKLEKILVQMVVEESVDCEDGGKAIVTEMVPYEVDTVIFNLMKSWIEEKLKNGRECLERAMETETWNPKSKTEPHAQSAEEIMKLARGTMDEFFEIPVGGACEDLILDVSEGLETLLQEYTTFVTSCGTKPNYIPQLPPLTRCNQERKLVKLWRKAGPCRVVGMDESNLNITNGYHPRPSTSRGTQRLYIRLNTLHYLLSTIHSLDKSLTLSIRTRFPNSRRRLTASLSYFDVTRSSIQTATQHISEIAAYRLIFLDSNNFFYDGLYVGDVTNSRIHPALRILKQNLTLLGAILTDRAQPLAVKEVMKAAFEAFLMVLLAGGGSRTFVRTDHEMIADDFANLKRVFCTCGEGLVAEEVVDRETEVVEGVVALMGQATEQLVEDLSIIVCEESGIGLDGTPGQKLPIPPTTGRWDRTDPNTILRVLCHRNDCVANNFLKKTFHLAKRI